jgi:putative PEP-CTERM system TPR-repeat lipoprotein
MAALLVVAPAVCSNTLDDARAAIAGGNQRSAVIHLKNRLTEQPEDAEARSLLAEVYLDLGQPAAAEQEIMRARSAGLAEARLLPILGRALLGQGRFDAVLERIRIPDDAPARERAELLVLRGEAELGLEEPAAAAALFEEAAALEPDAVAPALGLARVLVLQGDAQDARSALLALTERLDPGGPFADQAWSALGSLELALGRADAAVAAFTRAIAAAPGEWSHRFRRALARVDAGDTAGAREDVAAVAEVMPSFVGLAYIRGRLHLLEGEAESAVDELERYLRSAPEDPRGIYYGALALYQVGRTTQAEEYLVRLQNRLPNNEMTGTLLGLTRLRRNDAGGAEAAVATLAEAPGAAAATIEVLRRALLAQGRREEARSQLERLVADHPDLIGPRLQLARQRQGDGDFEAAEALVRDVLGEEPDNLPARVLLIRGLVAGGDDATARVEAEALANAAAEQPMAHTALAAVLARLGEVDAARAAFGKALSLEPGFTRAALGLAALDLGRDRPGEARKTLDELLAVEPDNAYAVLARAGIERLEGGTDAFIDELEQRLQGNPEALAVRLVLARTLLQNERAEAALMLLQETPPAQAEQSMVLLLRARAELEVGRDQSAQATLAQLVENNPESPQARYMLASVSARTGDLRAAESQLVDGLQVDRNHVLEQRRLAAILNALPGDRERAALLDRLRRAAPEHPRIIAAQAYLSARQRDFAPAIDSFEGLHREYPEDASYLIGLAQTLHDAGRTNEAAAALDAWVNEHPAGWPARMLLAQFEIARGREDAAVEQYRAIVDARPDNAVALNNLAMLIADTQPAEALALAERGLKLRPDDPSFLDTMGVVLMGLNQSEQARDYFAKAHSGTTDPSIAYRYAKALAATGDADGARRVLLKTAARSFPEKAEAEALLQRLGDGT